MVTTNENLTPESMEQKIISQIEYYFGDINLKRDKFIKLHLSQNDGWFPLEKLMTFNRLKTLTTDQELVVKSIKKSTSGLIEVSECGTKIRRNKPIPEYSEEYMKELNQRTLHLKGFPKDSTLDKIMEFCSQYGPVEAVQMRKNLKSNGEFKGCIFVTYAKVEDAEKILSSDGINYNDLELLKENKERYFQRKKEYYDSRKKNKNVDDSEIVKTEGAILKITGLNRETKFGEIKDELNKHAKVGYVSAVDDNLECFARFSEKNGAIDALKSLKEQEKDECEENKVSLELCGQKVEILLVTDEEEKKFWREFKQKQSMSGKKNKWQQGKRRQGNDGDNRYKKAKVDE